MKTLLLLFSSICYAQSVMINAGGMATGSYLTDQGFTGGFLYGPDDQPDPGWKSQTGIYSDIHYCTSSCSADYIVPNGTCTAQLRLIENRPAVSTMGVQAAAIGTRVFSVSVNGVSTGPIDIFATKGAQTPYSPPPITAPVTIGHLHFDFIKIVGNPSAAAIEFTCTQAIGQSPVGISCSSMTPITGVVLAVTLPDGSCLPVTMIAPPGFIPNNFQAVWSNQSTPGTLSVQSFYGTLTPAQ